MTLQFPFLDKSSSSLPLPFNQLPLISLSLSVFLSAGFNSMAQNFEESFYVPQQNRRNKLRVTSQLNQDPPPIAPSSQQILMSLSPPSLQDLNHQYSQFDCQECHNVSALGDFFKQNGGGGETRSPVPLGPFTGYASILKTSRFLKPAQQILDDLCGVNCEVLDFPLDCLSESEVMGESIAFIVKGLEYRWKNSNLTLMLEELYRRYKLYCHQMHSVVASFRSVAGLGNAAPYICYAIKIVSKHFTCLKTALLDQIQFTAGKTSDVGGVNVAKENSPGFWAAEQAFHNIHRSNQPNVCRSQRGLPDHAVAVLKAWLFEHFLHPYPTDSEKHTLAVQTGLSRTQVSNWFINARVRLWKPMVEEVHMLESQQAQVSQDQVNHNANLTSNHPQEKLTRTTENHSSEIIQTKRSRNEHPDDISEQRQDQRSKYKNVGASGSKDVSLALGLPQNNMIQDLPQGIPINMAHPLNLERISIMGSANETNFKAPNSHYIYRKD